MHRFSPGMLGFVLLASLAFSAEPAVANQQAGRFTAEDVFHLEFASDPQISPDGSQVLYVRNTMDVFTDKLRSRLWLADTDGESHRPLTQWDDQASSARWSPDGKRIAYYGQTEQQKQIFVRWLDTGQTARLTNLTEAASNLSWSPDGKWLAFSMFVPDKAKPFVELPKPPEGAKWADPPRMIERLRYRDDGKGYLKNGYWHLFLVSAEGGSPRQLTRGPYHHRDAVVWSPDAKTLIFSANRNDDWEYQPLNSDLHILELGSGELRQLTQNKGPDHSPVLSRDGSQLAWLGHEDRRKSYHQTELYLARPNGDDRQLLTAGFDRDVSNPHFNADGTGVYVQYDSEGVTHVGLWDLTQHQMQSVTTDVGGTTLGRPYASGSYSLSENDRIAFTQTAFARPADVAVVKNGADPTRVTRLNEVLLSNRRLASVETVWFRSSHDQRSIQGWIVQPPDFDPKRKYPLILEIHGGPFANYGPRFSAEVQLFAAAGYCVLYINPRGSTSYGDAFTSLIDKNYPSQDYDDLMSGVDYVLNLGYVDPQRLYVTGGSGGGVLSSWIVGKTNRFQAAVVAKPVINWQSFVLTADRYAFFAGYWFDAFPWEDPEGYRRRSPLTLVGNVSTPTMLLTGEVDYRTPISESEQFYQALKLRKVKTALVRVPDASHGIASRPSHLIAKVAYILKWFETHAPENGEP